MSSLKTLRNLGREAPYHWLLPAVFFCVGLVYLFASPNFEASDTERHVALINWIAKNGQLPVQSPSKDTVYRQQASQPPLYYLVMATIWRFMDTADFDDYYQPNPLVIAGVPERLGNRNLVFYQQPYPPDLTGTSLALYVIRALTLAMGAVTVAAVYQSARTVMPERPGFAALAASLVAFNPMFIFISASVSNDPPVSMLTALIAWQMLRMLRDGFQTRRSLILALLVAIAALTKLNGLVLGATSALAGCYVFYRSRDRRGFLTLGFLMLGFWLALSGWWYLRNLNLYGELFGTGAMLDNFGRRHISPGRLIREEFEGLRISFWALFGAFSILTHKLFYLAMDGLSLLGVAGLVLFVARNRRRSFALSAIFFLGLALALGGAMLIWWSSQTSASTGRLLFPYITSISLLLALGLVTLRIPPLVIALPNVLVRGHRAARVYRAQLRPSAHSRSAAGARQADPGSLGRYQPGRFQFARAAPLDQRGRDPAHALLAAAGADGGTGGALPNPHRRRWRGDRDHRYLPGLGIAAHDLVAARADLQRRLHFADSKGRAWLFHHAAAHRLVSLSRWL